MTVSSFPLVTANLRSCSWRPAKAIGLYKNYGVIKNQHSILQEEFLLSQDLDMMKVNHSYTIVGVLAIACYLGELYMFYNKVRLI